MKVLEKSYVIFALLYMARGVIPVATAQGDQRQVTQFDATTFALQASIFAILGFLIFFQWKPFVAGISQAVPLLALCVLAIFSAGWSSDPTFTLRRASILTGATFLGIYIASRFDLDEQLNLFGWLGVISVFGSICMAILFSRYGISHDVHSGDWKGLFPHKNALGQQMTFGILALVIGKPRSLPKGIFGLSLIGAILLLLVSHSATSIAIIVSMVPIYAVLQLTSFKRRKTLPLWLVYTPLIFLAVVLVAMNGGVILDILGRSATLTGRTRIWSAVVKAIGERAWLGYGYAVFWNLGTHGDARNVLAAIHWNGLRQAQSGYLDLCLDLGLVGLIVLYGFCMAAWLGLKLFRSGSTRGAKWPLIFLVFFLMYNFVESSLLQLYTFLWVPYVAIFVSVALMQTSERSEFEFDEKGTVEMVAVATSS
jgi:exopolysaccharide production protein ExoQ